MRRKDNILSVNRWMFSNFRKDLEFIYFTVEGKEYKRVFNYNSRYPYNYIFTFKNKKYRVQF